MPHAILLAFAALFIGGCVAEAEVPAAKPDLELTGRVVDAADILASPYETELTNRLAELEETTGVQLVVATTSDLGGREIAAYAHDLANDWQIGSAERLDGLLMLVAPNERRVRIEVGYGLEASVKDEEAAFIIYDDIVPHFEQGDFEAGIAAGVDRLIEEVTPYELEKAA